MDRSLPVLAADGSTSVPERANYWLCQQLTDWFDLGWLAENDAADAMYTAGAGAGVR